MLENTLRRDMLGGRLVVGAWCMLGDGLAAEIMANAGYDWLLVDMEHGPVSLGAAQAMITAIRTTDTTPLVRVPWNDSASIQLALDSGPYGILVPMVNTLADARRALSDARFLPLGARSWGGARAPLAYGTTGLGYYEGANEQTILMVQTETVEAVAAADEIAALEGVDALFVGPADLAASYGLRYPNCWENLEGPYAEAIRAVPQIARTHGKGAGILAKDAAMGQRCIDFGYNVVGIAVDATLLADAARRERTALG
ncbi:MAG: HpcH/HpaI aldolase family protein [Vulcanimicrobiaceae bacterium]